MMEKQTLTGWDNQKRPVQRGYPPSHVQAFCVQDAVWQATRMSMKGKPTHEKLAILEAWWDRHQPRYNHHAGPSEVKAASHIAYVCEVQVGNYLGALRRGGQLDADNQIRKYI
jgi:hypothetical protein